MPPENRFIWRRGHFSVPVAMLRNRAPLRRFKAVLEGIGQASRQGTATVRPGRENPA